VTISIIRREFNMCVYAWSKVTKILRSLPDFLEVHSQNFAELGVFNYKMLSCFLVL